MPPDARVCFLFDNGSLRPSSTLNLRQTAAALANATGATIRPVSLLHSDKVPAASLGGEPAYLLEQAVRSFWQENPKGRAILLPAFFGPSWALTQYVPERINALAAQYPQASWRLAHNLVDPRENDTRIATALAEEARRVISLSGTTRPKILLVDHGSPQRSVTSVREHLGTQLAEILGNDVSLVGTASMERREGTQFDFNEPLLERALRKPPFDEGDVIVLLQFLSPGRHAGPDGDIAAICKSAQSERVNLQIWLTEPIGTDRRVVAVLQQRLAEALAAIETAATNKS